jgi:hypothetical protein
MEIIQPNKTFDFSQITLSNPSLIQSGIYFTKLLNKNKPVYIQTPKSLTKQGFVKYNKSMYTELMFEFDEQFITWMEDLETKCHHLIFEKSPHWFDNSLCLEDIESTFKTCFKLYKSGKYYLLKTNIKLHSLNHTPLVKIYDEDEKPMNHGDITSDSQMISILEIEAIRFSQKNFQLEIELRQMMVLNSNIFLDNCFIVKNGITHESKKVLEETKEEEPKVLEEEPEEESKVEESKVLEGINNNPLENDILNDIIKNENQEEKEEEKKEIITTTELEEIDFSLDDLDVKDSIQLKDPKKIYYQMYQEAKTKAIKAREQAEHYLMEAENIKKNFGLEDFDLEEEDEKDNIL